MARTETVNADPPQRAPIEELFAALESPLLSYALRLLNNRPAAEDIVQDAFMKLHAQFDEVREPRPWLYRAVHNLALNYRRKNDKLVPFPSPPNSRNVAADGSPSGAHSGISSDFRAEITDPFPMPDEEMARSEGIGLVRMSIESLDPRSREVMRLKFHEDLSYAEIAAKTGLTSGHVGYLLHHALKTISVELAKSGVIP